MKRYLGILFLLLLLCSDKAAAQLQLITEFDFPERAILKQEEFDRFRYAKDGDWHIVSALIAGQRQSLVYRVSTGAVNNTNYIIENPWVFDSGRIYPGWPVDNQQAGWTYLDFNQENGQFYPRTDLPAFPQLIEGDLAYGVQQRNVYEMDPFALEHRILFTLPNSVSTSNLGWQLVDSTLYISHDEGVFVYELGDDILSTPFDNYIQNNDLVYVPFTGHQGKFLFTVKGEQNGFNLHELGHGREPRLIPQGEHPPTLVPEALSSTSGFKSRAVASGANLTWLTYFTRAENGFYTSHLIKVNRSEKAPAIDEVGNYTGRNISDYGRTPTTLCLEDGSPVALGWFGSEGSEPFGFINNELSLLNDFYEGKRGSVNYASGVILNMPSWLQRYASHNDHLYFPVNASYFGSEIAVSDGTRLLSDLEPGIRGLRTVEFCTLEEDLYFLVQKDDLSFAIYRLGSTLPAVPDIPEPDMSRDWGIMLGNEDGSQQITFAQNHDGETPIVEDGQTITYLSPRLDPTVRIYPDTMLNQQFIQIEMATGLPIREKKFAGGSVENSKILPGQDGGVNIIRLGGPGYRDNAIDTSLGENYSEQDKLFLLQFDQNLEFQSIKKLLGTSSFREYDLLIDAFEVDDGFVVLAREDWDRFFWLMHFSHDGDLKKNISIPSKSNNYHEANLYKEPDGGFQLAMHETRYNCDNCEIRIMHYTPELELRETWVAHMDGRIYHPRMFDMENGERWLLGAGAGSISLPHNRGTHLVEPVGQGNRGVFGLRWLRPFYLPADLFTYNEEIFKSYPGELHDGNLFVSYIRSVYVGQEIFEPFDYYYFSSPDYLVYEVAQLDDNGQMSQREELEVAFHGNNSRLYATSLRTSEDKWIRGLRAGSYCKAHFDMWEDPKPYYHDNFASRFQLISESWPFEPLPATVRPAEANEDGSYMKIFPNPNNGEFFVVPRNSGNEIPFERFHIYDMQGRLVFERHMKSDFNYKTIRLPVDLSEGVYHVTFKGPTAEETLRLVLAR